MGLVITSTDAAERFRADPVRFAGDLEMTDVERRWLVEMVTDLTGLTPSFVEKRRRQLSNAANLTLRFLGSRGDRWLDRYIEANPPVPVVADDPARWISWLVAEIDAHSADIVGVALIRSMAQLDHMRHRAFRTPGPLTHHDVGGPPSASTPLRLAAPTDLGRFDYDVRKLRDIPPETAAQVPPDPCYLLVYRQPGGRVMFERIENEAVLDALIDLSGQAHPIDDLVSVSHHPDGLRARLTRLYEMGALTT